MELVYKIGTLQSGSKDFGMSRWDTLKDLVSIRERVNRLFEDVVGGVRETGEVGGTWSPVVDIYETDKEFIVKAELPEVKQSDINIKVQDYTLTIEGERKPQRAIEGYHRVERAYGRFTRSFILPGSIDQNAIKATLKDGILQIVLPKREEMVPMQIEIIEK
jgi:HSP20 family protein